MTAHETVRSDSDVAASGKSAGGAETDTHVYPFRLSEHVDLTAVGSAKITGALRSGMQGIVCNKVPGSRVGNPAYPNAPFDAPKTQPPLKEVVPKRWPVAPEVPYEEEAQ